MKFPDYRLSMEAALPSSVDSWLEQELEQRGIDSLIYTRYIISLLRQDIEGPDIIEKDIDVFCKYKSKADFGRRCKKAERKKFSISDDELKKCAAIECLSAVSEEKAGIENLVEELCIRLKGSQNQKEPASPVSKLVTTNTDSSDDSGTENQNPVQRYYAAFPSLHGQTSSPSAPRVSPSVEGVWKNNPLVKIATSETSEEDISSANEDAEIKKINKHPYLIMPRNKKVRKNNSRNNNSRNTRENSGDQHKNRSRSQSNRTNKHGKKCSKDGQTAPEAAYQFLHWPPGFAKKDPFILQNLTICDEDDGLIMRKESPKRPDEELCNRVESLLKGMLLPTPEKTYKNLQDVDDETPVAKQENLTKSFKAQGNDETEVKKPITEPPVNKDVDEEGSHSSVSRDGSISPELQEQEFWYTQPIDVVFQSQDDEEPTLSSKLRLYKRNSYPSFSPDSDCSKDPNADCLLSSASSPVFERNRSLSFASQCSDDIWNGSVLIPGWLTEEISAESETLPDKVADAASISSFKASSPYPNTVEAECLFSLEASFHGEHLFTDSSQSVELTELDVFSTTIGQEQNWPCNQTTLASKSVDADGWREGSGDLFQAGCPAMADWSCEKSTEEVATPDYCSHACWLSQLDNNITPTPISDAEVDVPDDEKNWSSEGVSLVDIEYLSHFYENSDWNSMPLDETMKISSPKRFSLPNVWQGISSYEPVLDYTEDLNVDESLCWQPLAYGENSFSQLWDVNMQKRNKFSSWSCPNIFSEGRKWFGDGSSHPQKETGGTEQSTDRSSDNKNTLIPTISIDLLAESADTSQVDDFFCDFDADWSRSLNRSVSLGDVPSTWQVGSHKVPDPKLSKSFELVPSEHSAFCDVPKKLLQVLSEPNLTQLRHEFDKDTTRSDSPSVPEHLYFSPKTHFRPITPAYAPELSTSKAKHLVCHDLFGGVPTTKTPYMQYHLADAESEEDGFCPRFKVKNTSKCIQTGDSIDKAEEDSEEASDTEEERDTPETLTLGMIENIVGEDKDEFEPIISIADDLDTANTDSAYETDYGISALENEQENGAGKQYYQSECCHGNDQTAKQLYGHPQEEYGKPLGLGEVTDYTVESFAATFPHTQDWPDIPPGYGYCRGDPWSSGNSSTYQMQGWPQQMAPVDKQQDISDGDQSQSGPASVMPSWESKGSWCGDLITDHLYDESDAERYKDIWSTGQESFTIIDFTVAPHSSQFDNQDCTGVELESGHPDEAPLSAHPEFGADNEFLESDNCGYHMIFNFGDSHTEESDNMAVGDPVSEVGDNTSLAPVDSIASGRLTDSGYQCVRLVYKDKKRAEGDSQSTEQDQCFGDYNLMPMPNEALMSTDLEKEWLTRDGQMIWLQHRPSSLQRKPCSFFLEGNCRRADCKFAHDISNITCRFWEEGCCFKGDLCPFLHGYPRLESLSTSPDSDPSPVPEETKFVLNTEEFPELSLSVKNVNASKGRRSKQLKSQAVASGSRKDKTNRKGCSSRRHSNKENHVEVRIVERCSSSV